jgi:Co/Zn/Cd efflux system component
VNKFTLVKIMSLVFLGYCGCSLLNTSIRIENDVTPRLDIPNKSERISKIKDISDIDDLHFLLLKSDEALNSMQTYTSASQDVINGIQRSNRRVSRIIFLSLTMIVLAEVCERKKGKGGRSK